MYNNKCDKCGGETELGLIQYYCKNNCTSSNSSKEVTYFIEEEYLETLYPHKKSIYVSKIKTKLFKIEAKIEGQFTIKDHENDNIFKNLVIIIPVNKGFTFITFIK